VRRSTNIEGAKAVCDLTEFYLGALVEGHGEGSLGQEKKLVEAAAALAVAMTQFRNQVMGDAIKADQAVAGSALENDGHTTTREEAIRSVDTERAPALDTEADQS
jgi:Sec-independent protein translocase protein TatA